MRRSVIDLVLKYVVAGVVISLLPMILAEENAGVAATSNSWNSALVLLRSWTGKFCIGWLDLVKTIAPWTFVQMILLSLSYVGVNLVCKYAVANPLSRRIDAIFIRISVLLSAASGICLMCECYVVFLVVYIASLLVAGFGACRARSGVLPFLVAVLLSTFYVLMGEMFLTVFLCLIFPLIFIGIIMLISGCTSKTPEVVGFVIIPIWK